MIDQDAVQETYDAWKRATRRYDEMIDRIWKRDPLSENEQDEIVVDLERKRQAFLEAYPLS